METPPNLQMNWLVFLIGIINKSLVLVLNFVKPIKMLPMWPASPPEAAAALWVNMWE